MRDYYARNYGPNRATLTVVGAIDASRTTDRIHELFGGLPRSQERALPLSEPAQQGERRAELRSPHSVTRLCMGFPTCRMGERDDYALDVLAHDLGNSKNSRLYKRLVLADELVSDVSVINETRQDPGGFFVLCELRQGADRDRVERAVREEIASQIEEGVAKSDLARIRTQISSSFLFQDESALDQAMKIARFEAGTPNGYRTLEDVLPTYESLSPKELRQIAARYFDFSRATVVWAVPAQSPAPRRSKPKRVKKTRKPARKAARKTGSKAKR